MAVETGRLLEALGRKVDNFIVFHEIAQISAESPDLEVVLHQSLDKVVNLVAVDTAVILLRSEQSGEARAAVRGQVSPWFLKRLQRQPPGNGITARVALGGVPVVVEDIARYACLIDDTIRQEGLCSMAALPLKSNGRVIGTLLVGCHEVHNFSSEDIETLIVVAEGLGLVLRNAELYTALKEKTGQLEQQNRELVRKTKEAEEANRLKSKFLAGMSHELRTPLNTIIGFSELMLDEVPGPVNEEQTRCLRDMLDSARHLLSLIDEVLDLSRVESGRMEPRPDNVDITKTIESLKETMMPIIAPRRQCLEVSVDGRLPPIYTDESRVKQVLFNLLGNAVKFTPDGGSLRIEAAGEGRFCRLSVIDNGIGIKEEEQARIFEPFYQLDNPPGDGVTGTGLGLAVAREIVAALGGWIWVESEYGKGSCFCFTLPLSPLDKG